MAKNSDPINLIKQRFGQYLHSTVVLTRAVKSCQISEINNYLEKRLKQEPGWENKWNLVYAILTDSNLPKCKFCGKQLPISYLYSKQLYCSKKCEIMDNKIESTTPPIKEVKISLIQKILNIFKKN